MSASIQSLVSSADGGDKAATDALFAALYSELHRLAKRRLAASGGGASLGTTTLLHEAYLDIAGREGAVFVDRGRFMAYASRVMRGLVIDYSRSRQAQKRGGQFEITSFSTEVADPTADREELERISRSLDDLAAIDPALAEIVDLKFFSGFSFTEVAAMRGVAERTVQRHWEKARIYLHRALREDSLP